MAQPQGKPAAALDGAVLDLTRQRGVMTRPDLATALGVTPATITNVVKRLLADGLLVESGHSASTGGKRRTLLQLNAASRYAAGLSYDRYRLSISLTDFNGALVGRAVTPLPDAERDGPDSGAPDADRLPGAIADRLRHTLGALAIDPGAVAGVGLAEPVEDAVSWQHSPAAGGRNLLDRETVSRIGAAVGHRIVVRDEATCAALGELWTGSFPRDTCFATVYMSDQISAGLVLGGRAHQAVPRGSLGHLSIDRDGPPCPCGARGCVDVLASPAAVVAHVLTNGPHAGRLGLDGRPSSRAADFARIARAASLGDRTCLAAISDSAAALAVGVANLVTVLGLERIFLSGPGFSDAGSIYERVIGDWVDQVHRTGTPAVPVTLSTLDLESAAIGAAALVLQGSVAG